MTHIVPISTSEKYKNPGEYIMAYDTFNANQWELLKHHPDGQC